MRNGRGRRTTSPSPERGAWRDGKYECPPLSAREREGKGGIEVSGRGCQGAGAGRQPGRERGALDVEGEVPGAASDARNDARAHLLATVGRDGPPSTPGPRRTRRRRTYEPLGTAAATLPRPFRRSATSTCPPISSSHWTVWTAVVFRSHTVLSTTVGSAGRIRARLSNAPLSRDPRDWPHEPTGTNLPPLWQQAATARWRKAGRGKDASCDRAVR